MHIAFCSSVYYFHSRSVAAQYTMRGVGVTSMNTRISSDGLQSGSFLHRIIPKNFLNYDFAISQRTIGNVPQKLFKFTTFPNKILKNYFLFINLNYLKNIKNCLVHHFLSWKSICLSQTYFVPEA